MPAERFVMDRASAVLVPTPQEAVNLAPLYRRPPVRTWVIPPGADPEVFHPRSPEEIREARRALGRSPGTRLLVFAGRLEPFKGPDLAIRALSELLARAPALRGRVRVLVVGGRSDDPAREWPRGVARDAAVAEHVRFLPAQPPPDLASIYAAADVVLVPSRSESFGLVALEAQACGTPVLASATGGLLHAMAPGSRECLVPGQDPARFAEAVLRIPIDPSLAERLSSAGLEHAARFTWEATAARVRDLYELLVRSPRPLAVGV